MTNTARFTDIVLPSKAQLEYIDLLKVTDNICPGVVALPGKWCSQPVQTGAIANLLVDSACFPGGQPAYNDTFVNLESAS